MPGEEDPISSDGSARTLLLAGIPNAHWPTPLPDLKAEMQKYEGEFRRMKKEFADVDYEA